MIDFKDSQRYFFEDKNVLSECFDSFKSIRVPAWLL